METTGKLKDVSRDFKTGKLILSFVIDNTPQLDELTGCDALDITAKRHREKRSLDANAYFHVLVDKIRGKTGYSFSRDRDCRQGALLKQ